MKIPLTIQSFPSLPAGISPQRIEQAKKLIQLIKPQQTQIFRKRRRKSTTITLVPAPDPMKFSTKELGDALLTKITLQNLQREIERANLNQSQIRLLFHAVLTGKPNT